MKILEINVDKVFASNRQMCSTLLRVELTAQVMKVRDVLEQKFYKGGLLTLSGSLSPESGLLQDAGSSHL
jgi:hypothetical protein